MPEAMTGPAAIPFKKTTPRIVPKTKATVICGSEAISPTPLEERTATNPPQKIAIQPIGDLKASSKSLKPISPVAIGTKIAAVMIVTPMLIPLPCNQVRKNFDIGMSLTSKIKPVAIIKL